MAAPNGISVSKRIAIIPRNFFRSEKNHFWDMALFKTLETFGKIAEGNSLSVERIKVF
jgi:hypothetical protein